MKRNVNNASEKTKLFVLDFQQKKTSKIFGLFINSVNGLSANQFQVVHMNEIPVVEDLLTLNFPFSDKNIVNGSINKELTC